MNKYDAVRQTGFVLRRLIKENYKSQQEFADDFGLEIRTVSRYVNKGIDQVYRIQELADFFHVEVIDFFKES